MTAYRVLEGKRSRVMCSEACAEMLGFDDAWRFDPCVLRAAVRAIFLRKWGPLVRGTTFMICI